MQMGDVVATGLEYQSQVNIHPIANFLCDALVIPVLSNMGLQFEDETI